MKHPRNDDHIIAPGPCFAPLRTAYNWKNHSKLKGAFPVELAGQAQAAVFHTISPQGFHRNMTATR
jgi:hypothetical protein